MLVGSVHEVLVKRKAAHILKGIITGLLSIVMFIMHSEPKCSTMVLLYDCWRHLLLPEILEEIQI